jgi:hypothetical protein
MEKCKSYVGKIDSAFSFLLMSRNLIQTTIADSDSERAIELACSLVAQLIKSAIDELSPAEHSFLSSAEKFGLRVGDINVGDQWASIYGPPLVDVDGRIDARLREIIAISSQ